VRHRHKKKRIIAEMTSKYLDFCLSETQTIFTVCKLKSFVTFDTTSHALPIDPISFKFNSHSTEK
jgi:hypothetical protein